MVSLVKNTTMVLPSSLWAWTFNNEYLFVPALTEIKILDVIQEDYSSNTLMFEANNATYYTMISNLSETMNEEFEEKIIA